jgi:hypothetical protein
MKSRTVGIFLFLLSLALLAGCASQPKSTNAEIPMSSEMQPSEFNPQVMVYRNPDGSFAQYRKVMLEPVQIYSGPDADFKDVSPEDQQNMANYLYGTVSSTLQEKGLLATQPGPGVARLKLTLAGLQKTRPVASTVSHALPIGRALNLGKGAMGKNGSFMGAATVGGEFVDSTNGTLIASFLAKENPNAMDLPTVVSTWDASKKAMDKMAQQIADEWRKVQWSKVDKGTGRGGVANGACRGVAGSGALRRLEAGGSAPHGGRRGG